jgi:signal transduction histidine kinase
VNGSNLSELLRVTQLCTDEAGTIQRATGPLFGRSTAEWEGRALRDVLQCPAAGGFHLEELSSPPLLRAARLWSGDDIAFLVTRTERAGEWWVFLFSIQDALLEKTAAQVKLRTIVGSVIAGFAHEVRNPLAAIVTLLELGISTPGMPAESLEHLRKIQTLVYRVEDLLRLALQYGRPTAPKVEVHPLETLLEGSIQKIKAQHPSAPTPQLSSEDGPHYASLDSKHAATIFQNLLQNAVQATPHQPVTISVRALSVSAPDVAVDITDQGAGIGVGVRGRLFEPFFSTKGKGTGLGLAIARDLARLNGGDVLLLRPGPGGTTFRVVLQGVPPLAPARRTE